jgi:hypothetical protein
MAVSHVSPSIGTRAVNTKRDARTSQHAAVMSAAHAMGGKAGNIPVAKHRGGARGGRAVGEFGASRSRVEVGTLGRL